jgi:hypothetical protein
MLSKTSKDYSQVKLSSEQKQWIGKQIKDNSARPRKIVSKYAIKRDAVKKYAYRVKRGLKCHSKGGKPPILEAEDLIELESWVKNSTYHIRTAIFHERIFELAKARHLERGNSPLTFRAPCSKSIATYEKKMGIMSKHAEATTKARAEAVADIQNAISFAAMNFGIVPNVHSSLIINCDATQFTVGHASANQIEVKVLTKSECYKVLPDDTNNGITAYFIKYYLIMNASGQISHPVYVIADENMDTESIDVYRVPCLSLSCHLESTGWLVFCKTRCCNITFYRWLLKEMVIGFISSIKQRSELDEKSLSWFQLDGESIQIAPFKDEAILQLFNENNIIVGKPPASTTSITQPCDVGPCFIAVKSALKDITDKDVEKLENEKNQLKKIFNQHITKFSTKKKRCHQDISNLQNLDSYYALG